MTCGCQRVTGFGFLYGTQAQINAEISGNYNPAWQQYDTLYNQAASTLGYPGSFTIPITATGAAFFWKNVIEAHTKAFYQSSYAAGNAPVTALFQFLNGLAIKYGPKVFNLPPAQLATPGAMLYAATNGQLQLSQAGAAALIVNAEQNGIVPQSWWMTYGKPLAVMAAAVLGAEFLGASGSATGSGSGLAPTTISGAGSGGNVALAQPINIGSFAPVGSGGLTSISPVGALAGAGGSGVLSTLGTVAGVGSTALKGAAALTALKGMSAMGGATPVSPGAGAPQAAAQTSSIVPLLLIGGVGAGLFFALHAL